MNWKKALPYIAIYVMAVLAVPFFFSPWQFKPIPAANLYDGSLGFSGERAYEDLQTLTQTYPDRLVGKRNARLSALWAQERFQELGLSARIEEFDCLVKDTTILPAQQPKVPLESLTFEVDGYNVLALHPGKTQEAILIGAHRDTYGTVQGADDNGSGVVSVLELARVLTASDHYYTYIFAAWDGEEVGIRGSTSFIQSHPDTPLKLAISLDMTGYKGSTTVGCYQFVSSKGASPLWTIALARSLSLDMGLYPYYWGINTSGSKSAVVRFWEVLMQRTRTMVPTDSGPFVDRNMPALGLMAVKPGEPISRGPHTRQIHSPGDTIDQISPEVLETVGRYAERYVRSVEVNQPTGIMASTYYYVREGSILNPISLAVFAWLWPILAAALAALEWKDAGPSRKGFWKFLKGESLFAVALLAIAFGSASFVYLFRNQWIKQYSLKSLHIVWFVFTAASLGALMFVRQKKLSRKDTPYYETASHQKMLTTSLYALAGFALAYLANPFAAIGVLLLPVFLLGRVNLAKDRSRIVLSVVAIVWAILQFIGTRAYMQSMIMYPPQAKSIWAWAMRNVLWMASLLYIIVVPRRSSETRPGSSATAGGSPSGCAS